MDVTEQPMAQNRAHRRFGFLAQKVEQGRHGVAHRLMTGRDMTGTPQVYGRVPVAGQDFGSYISVLDTRLEELAVPFPMT